MKTSSLILFRSGVLRKSKNWTREKIKTRNDIFSTSHSARMLQFQSGRGNFKKEPVTEITQLVKRSNNSQIIIKIPWELRNRLPKAL